MFITFEGGEGTGKSTQVKLLAERLRGQGRDVVTTREPGGTPEAEALRALLVSGATGRWSANEELLLNFAARGSHLRGLIKPALAAGKIVICDRFVDSSFVYQCVAGGASKALFAELVKVMASDAVPDRTLILDIVPDQGLVRAQQRAGTENRFESKGQAFHGKVRDGFLQVARKNPTRCKLIDASGSIEGVAQLIWQHFHG